MTTHTRKHTSNLGFTLVEVLIYMGLLMSFMLVLSAVFSITLSTQTDSVQTQQLNQDAQYLQLKLSYDIHNATAIASPLNNGATSATFSLTTAGVTATYFVENNAVKVTRAGQTYVLTSPETVVTNFSVQRLGNDDGLSTLTISATLNDRLSNETRILHVTAGVKQ